MSVICRSIVRDDVPAVVAMLADDPLGAKRERFEDPLPECYWRAFEAIDCSDNADIIVAELEGVVVGCLQYSTVDGLARQGMRRAQIEAVRVATNQRGSGIGEALCLYAIERARADHCGLVELTSDKTRDRAHHFYERLGFVGSHLGMKLALHH